VTTFGRREGAGWILGLTQRLHGGQPCSSPSWPTTAADPGGAGAHAHAAAPAERELSCCVMRGRADLARRAGRDRAHHSEEAGRAVTEPRRPRGIEQITREALAQASWSRPHFVGIGGSGMAGLARILSQMGYRVSGSDLVDSAQAAQLRAEGSRAPRPRGGPPRGLICSWSHRRCAPTIRRSRRRAVRALGRQTRAVAGLAHRAAHTLAVRERTARPRPGHDGLLPRAGLDPGFMMGERPSIFLSPKGEAARCWWWRR